jgi:hypothetical protein
MDNDFLTKLSDVLEKMKNFEKKEAELTSREEALEKKAKEDHEKELARREKEIAEKEKLYTKGQKANEQLKNKQKFDHPEDVVDETETETPDEVDVGPDEEETVQQMGSKYDNKKLITDKGQPEDDVVDGISKKLDDIKSKSGGGMDSIIANIGKDSDNEDISIQAPETDITDKLGQKTKIEDSLASGTSTGGAIASGMGVGDTVSSGGVNAQIEGDEETEDNPVADDEVDVGNDEIHRDEDIVDRIEKKRSGAKPIVEADPETLPPLKKKKKGDEEEETIETEPNAGEVPSDEDKTTDEPTDGPAEEPDADSQSNDILDKLPADDGKADATDQPEADPAAQGDTQDQAPEADPDAQSNDILDKLPSNDEGPSQDPANDPNVDTEQDPSTDPENASTDANVVEPEADNTLQATDPAVDPSQDPNVDPNIDPNDLAQDQDPANPADPNADQGDDPSLQSDQSIDPNAEQNAPVDPNADPNAEQAPDPNDPNAPDPNSDPNADPSVDPDKGADELMQPSPTAGGSELPADGSGVMGGEGTMSGPEKVDDLPIELEQITAKGKYELESNNTFDFYEFLINNMVDEESIGAINSAYEAINQKRRKIIPAKFLYDKAIHAIKKKREQDKMAENPMGAMGGGMPPPGMPGMPPEPGGDMGGTPSGEGDGTPPNLAK